MKNFLFWGFLMSVSLLNAQQSNIVDTHKSREAIMQAAGIDEVRWTDGFWAERYDQAAETTLRILWERAADPDAGHVLDNFRAAATGEGERAGTHWQDAWLYKWIESAASVYKKTNSSWIDNKMDEAIELIAAAQEEDGYIATQTTTTGTPRFVRPHIHEVYTMGHLLTAGVIHKRMTGKTTLFDVAIKNADFLVETLGVKISPSFAHNPSAIMGLVELYRETGEQKYLDCAKLIVDSRGTNPQQKQYGLFSVNDFVGTDHIQDRTPLRESKEVVGHNVFFTYLFAGATDVYLETGDETLLQPLEHLWHDLTYTKMSINGGVSPMGVGLSPTSRDIVNEAVGAAYHLPNANSYNETCGQVGNFMWNYRMLSATGNAKYADIMELELYNGFLGGVGLDGQSWFYRNVLRLNTDFEELDGGHNFEAERTQPGPGRICCPTNVLRTMVQLQTYMYTTDENGLWIHHFAGNTFSTELADGNRVQITQVTDYPWDGKIKIKIEELNSDTEFAIRIRIPSELKLEVSESEFPFGIKTLEGKALYYDEEPWDGVLYRPLNASNKMERLPISLIPYFAWNNRGTTAMTVWLPLELQ